MGFEIVPTVVLLHGANGSHKEVMPLADALRTHVHLLTPDLQGHGGRPLPERLTVPDMAADILRMLDEQGVDRAFFVGYSFGGYLAIYLARHFPERVRGICTLAAKVVLDEKAIAHYLHLLNAERMARTPGGSGRPRGEELAELHHPQDWRQVVMANRAMFEALGTAPALVNGDLQAIRVPALVMSGASDQIVSAAETRMIGEGLRAKTFIYVGIAHPLKKVPIQGVAEVSSAWIAGVAAAQDYAAAAVPVGAGSREPGAGQRAWSGTDPELFSRPAGDPE